MPVTSVRVVAYVRVSTEEQAEEGVSLEAQEEKLRAYCAMRGLHLVAVIKDPAVSAVKPLATRRGGRRLLDLVAENKVDAVLAWKLDRLFRDCVDCLTMTSAWEKQSVALHLIDMGGQAVDTSSSMGRFFLTIMAGAAELQVAQVKERTRLAMRYKKSKGEYLGGKTPYGFQKAADGIKVEPHEQEAQLLTRVRELRTAGGSLREIAVTLASEGLLARTGKPLAPTQVARMLKAA